MSKKEMEIKKEALYFSVPMNIYPRTLFIVKGISRFNKIAENFTNRNGEPIMIDDADGSMGCCVWTVIEKIYNKIGYLVLLNRAHPNEDFAHESTYVAFETFRDIGASADEDNQEPFAYLVGWTAKMLSHAYNYIDTKNK